MSNNDNIPNYMYKLAMTEDVIAKGMVRLLADFNIHGIGDEKALKLFYSILAHLMYHLDTHPGQYFKLKFLDIVSDENSFLYVKRNSDYSMDTVTPRMFYNRYCGTKVLREELQQTLDLFAKSFLGIKEEKQKVKERLDRIINRRAKIVEDIKECNDIIKYSKQQKEQLKKDLKKERRAVKKLEFSKNAKHFMTAIEERHMERYEQEYITFKAEIEALYDKDCNNIPFE